MSSSAVNCSFRVDREIKRQCEAMYNKLGLSLAAALNVFMRQSLRAGGFPFDARQEGPNRETLMAMIEAESIAGDPDARRYSDAEEALKALKEE